tara:strand:+ start:652 stop:2175 length:1524 start_codon:yes stop_codon:yes gene_type:complete
MSTTGTKVPAILDIPADVDPKIKRVLESIKEASEVRLGRRGDPRDRAITLRELVDSGLAVELKDNPFDPNAGTGETDFALPAFVQPDPSAPVPPTPTGLSAGAAFTTITLDWDDPQIRNLAFTEVWRNGSDNLGSAVRVDTVSANVWSDTVDTAQTFYYWVRHVNTNSVTGTFSSSVNATTAQVNAARIQDAIIDNTKLVNKTLTNTKIADGTITSDILAANSVIAGKIATNAIVANDGVIGTAAIATAQIVDAAINNAKIADLAVDAAKMANATITSAKIGSLEVKSSNIDNLAITTGKIANAAITNAKINDLDATKITAGSISANRIAANSLDIAGKGVVGSAGNITGTVGVDVVSLSNDTDTENTLSTWFASNPPHFYNSKYMTLIASATWTTPAFTGTRTYVVTGQGQPIGSFGGDEDTAAVLLVRQTSSATGFQSSSSSDFEIQTGIFNEGSVAANPIVLAGSFSASGSLQYYAYLLMAVDDYGSGNKGMGDASILIYGLGA